MRAAFVAALRRRRRSRSIAPTTLLARQHYASFRERFRGFPVTIRTLSRFVSQTEAAKTREGLARRLGRYRHRHPCAAGQGDQVPEPRAAGDRRGAAFRRRPQGAAEGVALGHPCPDPDRHADPADLADVADRGPRSVDHRHAAGRPAGDPHLCLGIRRDDPARGAAARTLPRRPVVLRGAADRRSARDRGIPARPGARGQPCRGPRPDAGGRTRRPDERLLRRQVRCAAGHLDYRKRPRHPDRKHDDRASRRHVRAGATVPDPRPGRPRQDPRLCLSDHQTARRS